MGKIPTILGIGGSDHDVHACLVRDGKIVVTIEEERISRKKYGLGGNLLEGNAQKYCLQSAGVDWDDIDEIVVDTILAPTAYCNVRRRARKIDHHLAHAAAAWLTSDFDTCGVLVVDNAGGLARERDVTGLQATSYFRAEGRNLHLIKRILSTNWHEGRMVTGIPYQRGDGDHSLGHFFKKISGALGFRYVAETCHRSPSEFFFPEDGKTMGLAAYGDLRFLDEMWKLVEIQPCGDYRFALNDGRLDNLLADWLCEESDFETRAAIAAAAQEVLTRIMCHLVEFLVEITGQRQICLSGGVAMNSSMNGEIFRRTLVERLYIPPMPGDNGTGVGAALWALSRNEQIPVPAYSVYTGRTYGRAEIDEAVNALDPLQFSIHELTEDQLLEEVADRLSTESVVGWFEGGSENGRRALGHRSIFADPQRRKMRDYLNHQIKRREDFRPFGPVVIEERAREYFDLAQPSPYMQIVANVSPNWRDRLAAVTHVDGTARVQTVNLRQHSRLYHLLEIYERKTGMPILLNTSFNSAGEPIVETPKDAVSGFMNSGIDALILEDRLIIRR